MVSTSRYAVRQYGTDKWLLVDASACGFRYELGLVISDRGRLPMSLAVFATSDEAYAVALDHQVGYAALEIVQVAPVQATTVVGYEEVR